MPGQRDKAQVYLTGKPTQNSYVERFNGSYRRAIIFRYIEEVRELTEKWRTDYNENWPHKALGNMTPMEYTHASDVRDPLNGTFCPSRGG